MATVKHVSPKKKIDALDIKGLILNEYPSAKDLKVESGPRYSKFSVSQSKNKFKVQVSASVTEKDLVKLLRSHFEEHKIEVIRFEHLAGDVVLEGVRFFITINLNGFSPQFIDGSITAM
ncbi:MAG: hypothetical protein PHG25_01600 [Candidatus Pacebacteria bacterium]|nr:hypothetical protein [Candidatus Paceibacterota bacterium]